MSPPLHVLHAQVNVVPAGIVLAAGLNELFVTEIPPVGTGVFPPGPVVSPPPPQAAAEINASVTNRALVVIAFSIPETAVPTTNKFARRCRFTATRRVEIEQSESHSNVTL